MTIGQRSVDRSIDEVPPPGAYNPDSAMNLTKPSSKAMTIKMDSISRSSHWRKDETSPDPGHYYDAKKGFGYNTPRMTINGLKPKWKPMNENPGPGSFDA